jgi:hypothetical protein
VNTWFYVSHEGFLSCPSFTRFGFGSHQLMAGVVSVTNGFSGMTEAALGERLP